MKGDEITFRGIEEGEIFISKNSFERLALLDQDGRPVYLTDQIVDSFVPKKNISIQDNHGFAVRFKVPKIKNKDFCIIRTETRFPHPITMYQSNMESLSESFRYDAQNSGHTEYVWFVFDKTNPAFKMPGKWEIEFFNENTSLGTYTFSLK